MFFKNIPLLNKPKSKCVITKRNLYFFDVVKNGQILPSKVFDIQYDDRHLFSRKMENIRSFKEVILEKRTKFMLLQYSFWYFKAGESFSSFYAKCFDKSKIFLLKTLKFLIL